MLCYVLLALLLVTGSHGARILGVFPFPSRSHMIVPRVLLLELASRGHQVTEVTPFLESKVIPNYAQIAVSADIGAATGGIFSANMFELQPIDHFNFALMLWSMGESMCNSVLQQDSVQKIIHSTDLDFDVVITAGVVNECFLGFAHKFKAHIIQICPYGGGNFMADWVGSPHPYSYVPDEFMPYTDKMNFWERTHNTIVCLFKHVGRQLIHVPKQNAAMRKHFNYTDSLPPVWELEYKTSLVLINTHHSLSYPKPLMPNYVQVGGMHVKPPTKLPQELQQYLDEASDGVIYFSMGSQVKGYLMPESKRNAFLGAFSKLKQRVLWKWESDTLPGQPSNVKIGKWLPQSDILAHSNIRLFITHGGQMSSIEAITRGVPLLGVPVYADQRLNMAKAVLAGYGLQIDFNNISTESLTWAIQEAIESPKYRENVQRLSRIFRDQPLTPLEQAVYWTEYVIRHKGAPHLRSAVMDLAWYQYFLLDVIAVLGLATVSVLLILLLVCRVILKKVLGCKSHEENTDSRRKKRN